MSLDAIVSVQIQAGTVQPAARGFGVPCFLTFHTRFAERFRVYTSVSGLLADGFTVNDSAYRMAAAAFSQSPRPERVLIGRLPAPSVPHTVEIDLTGLASGQTASLTVTSPTGVATPVSQVFATSAGATATALAASINAITGIAASATGAVITADADDNGPVWFFDDLVNCVHRDVTGDVGYDTELGLLEQQPGADFYAVAVEINSPVNIADVAAWAASTERLAVFAPQYTLAANSTAYANALRTGGNDRAASLVRRDSRRQFSDAGWLGRCLPFAPGSETWAYKRIVGSTTDAWSASDLTTLETDNSNHYTEVAALPVTRQGKAHGGEWIDVVRGLDWLKARLQERIFALLANVPKVPYTDSGAQQIVAEVRSQLLEAEAVGVLSPGESVVTVVPVADQTPANRAARRLAGVEFQARLAGAIHTVQIVGVISV